MKIALTIAGSDSSGGAGIQADIKTMTAHGIYAMSAITALTAQNTLGVKSIHKTPPNILSDQLDCIFTDIFPDAVKIGMIPDGISVKIIAEALKHYNAKNIVLDPVIVATRGAELSDKNNIFALKTYLSPLATVMTPNIYEAQVLSQMNISSPQQMETAAKHIFDEFHCAVLLKGGHSVNDANDLLVTENETTWFSGSRIDNPNTHGTGCTLSSAICSSLAMGFDLKTAINNAKNYISGALSANLNLGHGQGPLNHTFGIKINF